MPEKKPQPNAVRPKAKRAMKFTSNAFESGATIPKRFTADGDDKSPGLQWSDSPTRAQSFAVICEDPDAPRKTWTHWVLFNLPAYSTELAEGVPTDDKLPNGAVQGQNDFGRIGYGGPSPPAGKPHRYIFHLYALDRPINLPAGSPKHELEKAVKGHILDEAQLIGVY